MSPAALKVALLVEVIAAACVIDPPVEVTDKTGAVPPARATLPPLVTVTVRVVVEVMRPVVIDAVEAGADRVNVDAVAIVPVVMEPVDEVIVRDELLALMLPVVTEFELIVDVLAVLRAPRLTVPAAALTARVLVWKIPVWVMDPAVAVRFSVELAETAPKVMLPAVEVTFIVALPPFWRAATTVPPKVAPEIAMSPPTEIVEVLPRTEFAVSLPAVEVAEMVRVEEVVMLVAVI